MRRILVAFAGTIALSAFAFSAGAETRTVYKFVDKHGSLVYSDTPVAGAEAVEVQSPGPIGTTVTKPPKQKKADQPDTDATHYQKVGITTPSSGTTFNNEDSPIVISGFSQPPLKPGDQYRFVINGQPSAPQKKAQYSLTGAERGEYAVTLEIVDRNLQPVIQSSPITFFVQRHSILKNNAASHR